MKLLVRSLPSPEVPKVITSSDRCIDSVGLLDWITTVATIAKSSQGTHTCTSDANDG
jgi:hypothetical protein